MHCLEVFSCSFFLCRLLPDVETDVKTSEAAVFFYVRVWLFDQLSLGAPLLETLDIVSFQNNVMDLCLMEIVLIRFKTDIGSKAQLLQGYIYQVKKLLHVWFLGFAVQKFVVLLVCVLDFL